MITKFGKIKATRNGEGVYAGTFEMEILVLSIGGRDVTMATETNHDGVAAHPPQRVNTYRGINPENEDSLMSLLNTFSPYGIKSYEWLEPLTEIPSQGGGSGLTIEDVYPVGIEITTTDTTFNPMKVWGGTWKVSLVGAKRVWTRTA